MPDEDSTPVRYRNLRYRDSYHLSHYEVLTPGGAVIAHVYRLRTPEVRGFGVCYWEGVWFHRTLYFKKRGDIVTYLERDGLL